MRETVPENDVASLQEELAAAKLREAEANLALKDLKSKVAELSSMWKKHLQQKSESDNSAQTLLNFKKLSIYYLISFLFSIRHKNDLHYGMI